MIKIGETAAKVYVGDMQPVNIYKGATKVAGWHSQTVSGTGTISLDGAYNVPPDALVVDGKCVQDTTTGKNLLVFPYYDGNSKTTGGVTFTVNPDGSVHAAGTATSDATFYINNAAGFVIPAGTYTFSGCPSGGNADNGYFMRINYSGFVLTDIGAGATATRASVTSSTVPIYIRVRAGATVNHTFYPQLELGSTATAYEPYTGGKPSPSPEYPQPITAITGDITITGSNGDLSDTATASLGAVEICSLPDGTKDEYDAVTGVVTKRVGKKIFDGTESLLQVYSNPTYAGFLWLTDGLMLTQRRGYGYCTHWPTSLIISSTPQVWFGVGDSIIYFANTASVVGTTSGSIKSYIAAQYAAGTPVTVYYKLATPYEIQLTPDLPVVRTGIKTLTVSANVMPSFTATVKAMDD